MSRDGLVCREREQIRWHEIEKVEFSHTAVVTKKDGTRTYLFDVFNLELFLALARVRLATGRFDLDTDRSSSGVGSAQVAHE
jgi:hypothetical protein